MLTSSRRQSLQLQCQGERNRSHFPKVLRAREGLPSSPSQLKLTNKSRKPWARGWEVSSHWMSPCAHLTLKATECPLRTNLALKISLPTFTSGKFMWIFLQIRGQSYMTTFAFSSMVYFLRSTVFFYPQCPGGWSSQCVWPAAQTLRKWCCVNMKHYLEIKLWSPYWVVQFTTLALANRNLDTTLYCFVGNGRMKSKVHSALLGSKATQKAYSKQIKFYL